MKAPGASLQFRLFLAFALVTIVAAAVPALVFRGTLYDDRVALAENQALAQAAFARDILVSVSGDVQTQSIFQTAKALSFRMTWIDASGRVLRDSHFSAGDVPELDNHGDRPEIEAARATGKGVSLRHSNTLGIDAVYAAVAMPDGGVLRVAVPLADVRSVAQAEWASFAAIIAGVAVFCLLLSALITAWIHKGLGGMAEVVAAIARDKGRKRLREVPGREFLPLAHAVNYMADTIEDYMRTTADQQSQLETILDSMNEGVLVLGPRGAVRRWNRAMGALFPALDGAEGKPLIESIPVPTLQRRVDAVLGLDKALGAQEITPGMADEGSGVHFELPPGRFLVAHVSRPATPNDSLGAVIVVYDATEIMRLEGVRRDFVANVSHELRTPLTAIAGYAETLMSSDDLSPDYRKFAGIIHKHAAMLAGTVSDLLALARVENTREPVAFAPTAVAPVVEDALDACAGQAEAKDIRVEKKLDGTPVLANGPLLTQALRNLLENAFRYSPEGGTVRVSAKRQGSEVLFTVSDNGPGIPKEAQGRIFERFYQVKKERNSGTSGIGLAICKHIVERHGGRIWVESPHGDEATAMRFTLPVA